MHAIPGRRPVAEALRAGRPLEALAVDRGLIGSLSDLIAAAEAAGVAVQAQEASELAVLADGVSDQGIVALAPDFAYRPLADLADGDLVVMLDGITDPQNLGAIARSAEVAGASGLILPRRRSAHVTAAVEKAAAGALSWLPVALTPNLARAVAELAECGFWSVGLDADAETDLWDCQLLDGKAALVIGGEERGLSRLVSERVDERVRIPMRGRVAALNASTAAAIALFEVVRRRAA